MAEDAQKKTSDTESSIERCIQYVETKVCPTSVTKQARAELAQLNQAVEAATAPLHRIIQMQNAERIAINEENQSNYNELVARQETIVEAAQGAMIEAAALSVPYYCGEHRIFEETQARIRALQTEPMADRCDLPLKVNDFTVGCCKPKGHDGLHTWKIGSEAQAELAQLMAAALAARDKRICAEDLTITHDEFAEIYAEVCERMKDLVSWRPETVAKTTLEEALVFIGNRAAARKETP